MSCHPVVNALNETCVISTTAWVSADVVPNAPLAEELPLADLCRKRVHGRQRREMTVVPHKVSLSGGWVWRCRVLTIHVVNIHPYKVYIVSAWIDRIEP